MARSIVWVSVVFSSVAFAACGGRVLESGTEPGDGGAGGSAFGGYAGGDGGFAGSFGGDGGFGGAFEVGGSVTATGGSACFNAACASVQCGPGEAAVTPEGQCCPTCEACPPVNCPVTTCPAGSPPVILPGQCCPVCGGVNCAGVDCVPVPCSAGYAPITPPGGCCPVCTAVDVDASVGQCTSDAYQQLVDNLIAQTGATKCASSADCFLVSLNTNCPTACSTAVNPGAADELLKAIRSNPSCTGCYPQGDYCPASQSAECVDGICTAITPL